MLIGWPETRSEGSLCVFARVQFCIDDGSCAFSSLRWVCETHVMEVVVRVFLAVRVFLGNAIP